MKSTYRKLVEEVIYKMLYKKSSVDGVRILYEDQWPIEELADLFIEKNAMGKAIYKLVEGEPAEE